MNFQTKDKVKRIKIAKELFAKGFTMQRLADYFDVSKETVDGYLKHDIMHDGNKEIIIKKETQKITLNDFTAKTTTVDKVLPKVKKLGDTCKLCREYAKYENMIKWDEDVRICRQCYATMDKEKMDKLNS